MFGLPGTPVTVLTRPPETAGPRLRNFRLANGPVESVVAASAVPAKVSNNSAATDRAFTAVSGRGEKPVDRNPPTERGGSAGSQGNAPCCAKVGSVSPPNVFSYHPFVIPGRRRPRGRAPWMARANPVP